MLLDLKKRFDTTRVQGNESKKSMRHVEACTAIKDMLSYRKPPTQSTQGIVGCGAPVGVLENFKNSCPDH